MRELDIPVLELELARRKILGLDGRVVANWMPESTYIHLMQSMNGGKYAFMVPYVEFPNDGVAYGGMAYLTFGPTIDSIASDTWNMFDMVSRGEKSNSYKYISRESAEDLDAVCIALVHGKTRRKNPDYLAVCSDGCVLHFVYLGTMDWFRLLRVGKHGGGVRIWYSLNNGRPESFVMEGGSISEMPI